MDSTTDRTYTVRGMICGHCELSVTEEVSEVAGVTSAEADRTTGRLVVRGEADDAEIRAAVAEAGYEVAA